MPGSRKRAPQRRPAPWESPAETAEGPELQVIRNVLRVNNLLVRRGYEIFRPFGLSQPQYAVLRTIERAGSGGVPLSRIKEDLLVSCGNVTGLIDRLERDGYVQRSRTAGDRRVVLARLTQAGRRVLRRIVPVRDAFIRTHFGGFARGDINALARLLRKLLIDLDGTGGGGESSA